LRHFRQFREVERSQAFEALGSQYVAGDVRNGLGQVPQPTRRVDRTRLFLPNLAVADQLHDPVPPPMLAIDVAGYNSLAWY
jgi:hypothetical protein